MEPPQPARGAASATTAPAARPSATAAARASGTAQAAAAATPATAAGVCSEPGAPRRSGSTGGRAGWSGRGCSDHCICRGSSRGVSVSLKLVLRGIASGAVDAWGGVDACGDVDRDRRRPEVDCPVDSDVCGHVYPLHLDRFRVQPSWPLPVHFPCLRRRAAGPRCRCALSDKADQRGFGQREHGTRGGGRSGPGRGQ